MVAAHHAEQPSRIRKTAFLDVLDPRAIDADRHLVLSLAGDGAGVTADAFAVVDDKSEIHSGKIFPRKARKARMWVLDRAKLAEIALQPVLFRIFRGWIDRMKCVGVT